MTSEHDRLLAEGPRTAPEPQTAPELDGSASSPAFGFDTEAEPPPAAVFDSPAEAPPATAAPSTSSSQPATRPSGPGGPRGGGLVLAAGSFGS